MDSVGRRVLCCGDRVLPSTTRRRLDGAHMSKQAIEFRRLKGEFFDDYLRREPEEATTLGCRASGSAVKAWSREDVDDEIASWRRTRDHLDRIEPVQLTSN